MDAIAQSLLTAQSKAEALFREVVESGMIAGLAVPAGWEFGAITAGHLIGHFPHEREPTDTTRFSIRHGNNQSLREPDANGRPRHWILEIHFVDRVRKIGGFFEELLTVEAEPDG